MKILDDNKNVLIAQYISGTSVQALARKYTCNNWTVKNFLIKNGIKPRTRNDLKIKFKEDFFFEDTAETYYFWGFMLGDGSLIHHKQGHKSLTVTLKSSDRCIIEKFCNWLQMDLCHIKTGVNNYNTSYVRLTLNGKIFQQDFSKFGFVPRKTYNPVIPDINANFIKPFILGLIDADGSVSWHKPLTNNRFPHRKINYEYSITLVGHPVIMNWVESKLRCIGFDGKINSQIVKNKWKRLRIQKRRDVNNFFRIMNIDNYSHLLLERKWKSAIESL